MQKKRKWTIVSVIAALLLVSWFIQLHLVADHAGVTLFQRGNEAYLFLGGGHTGWHFPTLAYPVVLAMGYLGVPSEPSDQRALSLVIRVTPVGTQSWINVASNIADLTPFEEGFYARCPGTVLCKWTDSGFLPASPEEGKSIAVDKLYSGSFDNKLVNGWNTHQLKFAPGDHFEIQLGDYSTIIIKNHSRRDGYPNVTVDLLRPGQAPENLYSADAWPHLISKAKYDQLLWK